MDKIQAILLIAVILIGIIILPFLFVELNNIVDFLPNKVLKFFCFVPCGFLGALAVKCLIEADIGGFVLLFCFGAIALYGGFSVKDMIN